MSPINFMHVHLINYSVQFFVNFETQTDVLKKQSCWAKMNKINLNFWNQS